MARIGRDCRQDRPATPSRVLALRSSTAGTSRSWRRGARVVRDVQRPFRRLASGLLPNGLAGVAEIVARGEPLPAFRPALLSLPLAFGTRLLIIPSATPYLRAEAQSLTNWKKRLEPARRRRIGLTWSGGPTRRIDR